MMEQLTEVDYKILNLLYIDGFGIPEIAKVTETSPTYIYQLLKKDAVQPLVKEFIDINEQELLGLELKSTSVLRSHLSSDSEEIQHKAIDKLFKRQGKYKEQVKHEISLEDELRKFLNRDEE